ncbi:glycerol metabolism activator [Synergistales bacterium]|nr:glycerol metabolism activator [Synergistales bacterium]
MRVLIAGDNSLFRHGLKTQILTTLPDVVIMETDTYEDTINALTDCPDIDILLIDPTLDNANWRRCLTDIFKCSECDKIVIISSFQHYDDALFASRLGSVFGCLSTRSSPQVIASALGLILNGMPYRPPMTGKFWPDGLESPPIRKLSHRQNEALHFIGQGMSNKQIAYRMQLSESTVKLHINALLKNLNVHNRTHAVVTAQQYGILV